MSTDTLLFGLFAAAAGLAFGVLLATLRARKREVGLKETIIRLEAQLSGEDALAQERERTLQQAEARLDTTIRRLADESLSKNSESFLRLAQENFTRHQERAQTELREREKAVADLVSPIKDVLEKTRTQIGDIEKERTAAFAGVRAQLAAMTADQQQLQTETRNLVNALRRPQVRGRWGELTLRRVAELAGMVEHCDFQEQQTLNTPEGTLRPDMIVRLPDRGELVVDVKTPLDAYIEAMEATNDQDRSAALQRHARNVAERVRELSAKSYWSQFATSPEFVILFIPGDQFLSAALSENPALLEEALRNKVVLTTPSSLVALLKAIAYGWRQLSLAENAEEIRRLGQELYERLTPFAAHLSKLGRRLEDSVKAFNDTVGSLERKVLPGARRLTELGIRGRQELESPASIDVAAREVVLPAADSDSAPAEDSSSDADDSTRPH